MYEYFAWAKISAAINEMHDWKFVMLADGIQGETYLKFNLSVLSLYQVNSKILRPFDFNSFTSVDIIALPRQLRSVS